MSVNQKHLLSADLEALLEKGLAKVALKYALLFLAVILYLVAWNRGIALIYGLFSVLVVVLLLAWLLPMRSLKSITVKRDMAKIAHEGEMLNYAVQLSNSGIFGFYFLRIHDWVNFAVAEQQLPMGFIAKLDKSAQFEFSVRCDLRGLHKVGPLFISSGYPLGIRDHTQAVTDSSQEILVYPSTFLIEQINFLESNQSDGLGDQNLARDGGHELYMGLREYRRGDPPRNIHWRASARSNTLYTKQYESVHDTEVSILLDLNGGRHYGEGKEHSLEYAIKIAASIAKYFLLQGKTVSLIGEGKERLALHRVNHINNLPKVLKVLALVEARPASDVNTDSQDYQDLLLSTITNNPQQSLVIFDHSDDGRFLDIHKLVPQQRKVNIRFNNKSFQFPLTTDTPKSAAGTLYHVRRGLPLRQVFKC